MASASFPARNGNNESFFSWRFSQSMNRSVLRRDGYDLYKKQRCDRLKVRTREIFSAR